MRILKQTPDIGARRSFFAIRNVTMIDNNTGISRSFTIYWSYYKKIWFKVLTNRCEGMEEGDILLRNNQTLTLALYAHPFPLHRKESVSDDNFTKR